MSTLCGHHKNLKNGVGKCSVPMWQMGVPAGFCDRPAYGNQVPFKMYERWDGVWKRMDGGYDGYVPALACEAHGGPTKEDTLNLCDYCSNCIAECKSNPIFGTGRGNDNVCECDAFEEKPEADPDIYDCPIHGPQDGPDCPRC